MTTYAEPEIRAYATGMASATGVDIRLHNGAPMTDGKTVSVPMDPVNSFTEFEAMCSTCNHEIAHVWFKTVTDVDSHAERIARKHDAEWAEFAAHFFLNVVADIADETRMERLMPGTRRAFRTGNVLAGGKLYTQNVLDKRIGTPEMPGWKWGGIVAILVARLRYTITNGGTRQWIEPMTPRVFREMQRSAGEDLPCDGPMDIASSVATPWKIGYSETIGLGLKCRATKSTRKTHRSKTSLRRLINIAEQMFVIALPFIDKSDGFASDATAIIDKAKAEQIETNIKETGSADRNAQQPADTSPDLTKTEQTHWEMDKVFANRALSGLPAAVDVMMETNSAMVVKELGVTGRRLGRRWVNLYTTGRVFQRPSERPGQELALALLVDVSWSIRYELPCIMAAAYSLARTMDAHGANVRAWTFGTRSQAIDWRELATRPIEHEISTRPHNAISWSRRWQEEFPSGRKMTLIITDGDLLDMGQSMPRLAAGARAGIEYFLIGINMSLRRLRCGWPSSFPAMVCRSGDQLTEVLLRNVSSVTI